MRLWHMLENQLTETYACGTCDENGRQGFAFVAHTTEIAGRDLRLWYMRWATAHQFGPYTAKTHGCDTSDAPQTTFLVSATRKMCPNRPCSPGSHDACAPVAHSRQTRATHVPQSLIPVETVQCACPPARPHQVVAAGNQSLALDRPTLCAQANETGPPEGGPQGDWRVSRGQTP